MKEIKLTQGKVALVDDELFEELNKYIWFAAKDVSVTTAKYYARCNHQGKKIKMHRLIMGVSDPKIKTDHKDGDGLNNQKENLRLCSDLENGRNKKIPSSNTSGYKGVHQTRKGKWVARIGIDYKKIHLGVFDNPVDAAIAYDKKAKELFGDFAKLNIKETK